MFHRSVILSANDEHRLGVKRTWTVTPCWEWSVLGLFRSWEQKQAEVELKPLWLPQLPLKWNRSKSLLHFAQLSIIPKQQDVSVSPPQKIHCVLVKAVSGPSGTSKSCAAAEATYYHFVSVPALKELVCLWAGSRHLSADKWCKSDANSSDSLLQALTSSFGYNYLPHSGILSTFVT